MAKEIFHSTEKSNFILNLTEEKFSGIASKILAVSFLMVSLFTIPMECSENVGFSIPAAGLAVSGVVCLILALIAIIRKFVNRKALVPVIAFAALVAWGTISLFDSYSVKTGFYGYSGRNEGLLALLFYFGFFVTGLAVKGEKNVTAVLNGLIATGLLNSVWSLIQIFSGKLGFFAYISTTIKPYAASGLSGSPLFLAMLLSLSLTAALVGSIMSEDRKRRIFCIVSTCVFSFVLMFTYSLIGVCGIVFALILAVISVFTSGVSKKRLVALLAVILPAAASFALVQTGVIGDGSSYKLYDGRIMWWDSYNRLSASGIYDNEQVDISSTADTYYFLFGETLDIIKEYPLTGSGPDQLVYPQLYSSKTIDENIGTFDRCYNEYLQTAATRGIPSLIAFVTVIASLLYIISKNFGKSRTSQGSTAAFFTLICGVILFFIGNSSIVFAPALWAVGGTACASVMGSAQVHLKKKHEKVYGKSEKKSKKKENA